MADPARYYIDMVSDSSGGGYKLYIERSQSGEWIKFSDFEDYKASRRRNSTEDAVTRLGIEVAELRSKLADRYDWRVGVGKDNWVSVKTTEEALLLNEEFAALAAEKEALVQQGIRDHQDWRSKLNFLEADYKAEIARLTAENERLRKAGDAMADDLRSCQADEDNKLLVDWLAAKEGRDAK